MIERGSKIGRFTVVTELGRGGMGAVYAAHDPQLDRQVALKVLRSRGGDAGGGAMGSDNGPTQSDEATEEDRVRLMREGQAMARVTHPNVITVYEVGTDGERVFLAQELLDGGTLKSWLEKPHSDQQAVEKLIAAGKGLAAAHAAGLVHRDFKPENVLLGKDGRIRVADFGLARAHLALGGAAALETTVPGGGPPRGNDADVTASPMNQLTRTGAIMGTPMFMAPEQHCGERADARSDQFAFCVSLYHALYKTWPYDGKTAPALAEAVISGKLAPIPKNANVSAGLRKIIMRGLATDPKQRYPSMEALLADLEGEARPGAKSKTPMIAAAVVLVVAAGGAGAYAVVKARGEKKDGGGSAQTVQVGSGVSTEQGITWLSAAIDRGQLEDAIEKYDLAATLAAQNKDVAGAAIAKATGAYMRVLHGDLKEADGKIAEATKEAGADANAMAYVDLAEAALAEARAQLPAARDRSQKCAAQFAATAPVLAAICHQLNGEALSALGDNAGARKALEAGLALAKDSSAERTSTLQLALAQLDLDEQQTDRAAQTATTVLSDCGDRGAIGCEVRARIMLARIRLGQGTAPAALELLTGVRAASIQTYSARVAHQIALGEVNGYMGEAGDDNVTGLDRIERARAQAEVRGFMGLQLDAKLARLRVLLIHDDPDGKTEHAALVKQARGLKAERIARLADAALKELAGPARDMLPADGGLPAVREGSSGQPGDE